MKLFSREFVKKEAVKSNIVLLFLYVIATPLSKLFVMLNITPNKITVGSIIFAILAFVSLIVDDGFIYFCVFWIISLHLDFCDGTVARMTGRINKTAFRFDHMSDIFKISLVFVGAAIHYNIFIIWVLSIAATFSFLYAMILNHDLGAYSKTEPDSDNPDSVQNAKKSNKIEGLRSFAKNSPIILNLFTLFATLNGHTLLFFLIIPFGIVQTEVFFIYFIFLTSIRSITIINRLVKLPKIKRTN